MTSSVTFSLTKAQAQGPGDVTIQGSLTGGQPITLQTGEPQTFTVQSPPGVASATINGSPIGVHTVTLVAGSGILKLKSNDEPFNVFGHSSRDVTLPNSEGATSATFQAAGQTIEFSVG